MFEYVLRVGTRPALEMLDRRLPLGDDIGDLTVSYRKRDRELHA